MVKAYVTIRSVIQDGERYAGVEVRPSTETTTKLRLSALQQEVLEAVASGVSDRRLHDHSVPPCRGAGTVRGLLRACESTAAAGFVRSRARASPPTIPMPLTARRSAPIPDRAEPPPTWASLSPSPTSPPTRCGPISDPCASAWPQGVLVEPDKVAQRTCHRHVCLLFSYDPRSDRARAPHRRRMCARLRRCPRAPRDSVSHRGDGLPRYADAARQPAGLPGEPRRRTEKAAGERPCDRGSLHRPRGLQGRER